MWIGLWPITRVAGGNVHSNKFCKCRTGLSICRICVHNFRQEDVLIVKNYFVEQIKEVQKMLAKSLEKRWLLKFLIWEQLATDFKYFLDQHKKAFK